MTKKDYKVIAKILREHIQMTGEVDLTIWANLCHDFARELFADNERFSYEKFYVACGFDTVYPTTDWRKTLKVSV